MNMNPAQVYERILSEVNDGNERKVFDVLVKHIGTRITRQQLVFEIWGIEIPNDAVADSNEDRIVRKCIWRLREKGFPIISSSGSAGYKLIADTAEIDKTIAEFAARIESEQDTIRNLYKSKQKADQIRRWRETIEPAVQPRLL